LLKPRKTVSDIKAYSPPLEGRRGKIRLDFNENTEAKKWGIYPEYKRLMSSLSGFYDLPEKNIFISNGTGEAIFLISFTFIEPGKDKALVFNPTFALIPHYLKISGSKLNQLSLEQDLKYNISLIEKELKKKFKIVMLASPDNPTGAQINKENIKKWCSGYPETLFVIDEAYAEYSEGSAIDLIKKYNNLIIIRTFSKAWGLAGLRFGIVLADSSIIRELLKVRTPYSINSQAVETVINCLIQKNKIIKKARELLIRKKDVIRSVENLGYKTHSGGGNFFLIKTGVENKIFCEYFKKNNILVRDQSDKHLLNGYVRVTVGTKNENERFLKTLKKYNKERAVIFDLDDTLVDVSKSYDHTILTIVNKNTSEKITRKDIYKIRSEGGFNDDWVTIHELLKRRRVNKDLTDIINESREFYLKIARDKELLLINKELLKLLAERFRIYVFTGRPHNEYDKIWGNKLNKYFTKVYCVDDFKGLKPKPSPEMLMNIMKKEKIKNGYYIGNSVDDMISARLAGLIPVGIEKTMDENTLKNRGAQTVLKNINDIKGMFML
jgi:histidinol-phosphate aminotransferase